MENIDKLHKNKALDKFVDVVKNTTEADFVEKYVKEKGGKVLGKKCKSILQKSKYCFICGKQEGLELHHIYFGPLRKISDANGFTVYLCSEHHRGDKGPHMDHKTDRILKRMCQRRYEKDHSREEFIALIGRNFI